MTNKPPDRVAVTMQINATEADIERWQRKAAEGGFASIQDYLASIFTQMCEDVGDGSEVLAVRVKNDEGIQGTWVKQPAWTGPIHGGCGTCSETTQLASMAMVIASGFGGAVVTKDGEVVFDGDRAEDFHFLSEFEQIALTDPDHDWRVHIEMPLREVEYQRHEAGKWVLIHSGPGFA